MSRPPATTSGAAQDGPDGLSAAFEGRPAPDVAKRADDLQSAPVLSRPARCARRGRLVARIRDREHDLADAAEQAQPERRRGRRGGDGLRCGPQPVPDGVYDEFSDDELGIVGQVPQTPTIEQLTNELARGPGFFGN